MKRSSFYAAYAILSLLFMLSCAQTSVVRKVQAPGDFNKIEAANAPTFLKVHMRNGNVFLLTSYITAVNKDTLLGQGELFNADRKKISPKNGYKELISKDQPMIKIPYGDIALVETNNIEGVSGKLLAMGFVGVPTAILSVFCLANPKACFGSCPTFYAWNGNAMKLMAEGFSSSILRSYEKSDVDMLYWSRIRSKDFELKLTNEALETHVIRYADLLVFPKRGEERIFATDSGKFYKTAKIQPPVICTGPEGDCRNLILEMDGKERYSGADSKNLARREYVNLEFNTTPGNHSGLVIGARQTLLTTYLFYQSLAYAGKENGYYASRIESGDKKMQNKVQRIWDLLGGIEVFIQATSGKWIKIGQIEEMGPIASDLHLITLPENIPDHVKIRLKMTKGLWRIDYAGVAGVSECVQPYRIKPSLVTTNDSINAKVLTQLSDTIEPLITLPGDSHILHYQLPGGSDDYEIFLKSKGYYLEWMREEWMAEQNIKKAYLMFGFPKLYLRLIAKKFKIVEPTMEESFWRSRYVKN